MVDGMTPQTALVTTSGITVAIYLTKPPSKWGRQDQEIHLVKLRMPPDDIHKVYLARN